VVSTGPTDRNGPLATIAVCSYNGADRIGRTIESLLQQTLPHDDLEILVIDNASKDASGAVARSFGDRVSVVSEPRPGLSAARNRALVEASGKVVAFIDDDAEAHPSWIENLAAAFDDDSVVGAGGPVELVWPGGEAPRWFDQEIAGFFSGMKRGADPEDLHAPDYPYGTNMAVRRGLVYEMGGFREDLGRIGTSLLSYEEYDLFDRIARTGAAIRYQPDAWVDHHVDAGRVSLRWLLRRAWVNGQSHVVWEGRRSLGAHLVTAAGALARVVVLLARTPFRLLHAKRGVALATADLARTGHWMGIASSSFSALWSRKTAAESPGDAP
jgi:glycosyltransferase involved in cell wall biosynthesis